MCAVGDEDFLVVGDLAEVTGVGLAVMRRKGENLTSRKSAGRMVLMAPPKRSWATVSEVAVGGLVESTSITAIWGREFVGREVEEG